MKEENLNILSFIENDQKVSALIVALGKIFDLISLNCEELDNNKKELDAIFYTINSIDKRLRALEEAKNTQTD